MGVHEPLPSSLEISSLEIGSLGVRHLKRLCAKATRARTGTPSLGSPRELVLDKMLIYGLGLPLEETLRYLYLTAPSYADLEAWVVKECGGTLDPHAVARINAAIGGEDYDSHWRARLDAVEQAPPVLTAEDLAFWDEQGYVIVRGAVPKDVAQAAEAVIWRRLGMDADDPLSWYANPLGPGIMVQIHREPELWATRRSARIHKAFAQLWGTSDLWLTVDRAGFNPPEREGWSFPGPQLHWDMDLKPPLRFSTQGILYLTDTAAEQGAFTCVPGFHRKIEAWLAGLPPGANPQFQDLASLGPVGIAADAGDLIVWNDRLPHGSRPNRMSRPRIVQYVSMFPSRFALDDFAQDRFAQDRFA